MNSNAIIITHNLEKGGTKNRNKVEYITSKYILLSVEMINTDERSYIKNKIL